MLIYLDIKIPHLQIAHLGGNLEVGNIKIHQVGGIKIVCTFFWGTEKEISLPSPTVRRSTIMHMTYKPKGPF